MLKVDTSSRSVARPIISASRRGETLLRIAEDWGSNPHGSIQPFPWKIEVDQGKQIKRVRKYEWSDSLCLDCYFSEPMDMTDEKALDTTKAKKSALTQTNLSDYT